ncbi:MAG: flagellar hook-associated protein FlgL [Candidatus Poribacteria bacterium]|nr:flagellar hook-associated protein FlgL [Candidatus Poribacteria bacterium]
MRITHQIITTQAILDMERSLRHLEKTRSEVASGRRLSRPSDDPIDVSRALGFRNEIAGIRQHRRNIDNALPRLNQTESVLDSMNEILLQLKQHALQLGTQSTVNDRDRENAVEQIQQLKEQTIQFANTKIGGQFIFAGSNTRTRPFEEVDDQVYYRGNNAEISVEIEPQSTVPINIPGLDAFDTSESGVFHMMNDFKTALMQNDKTALKEIIDRIDAHTETILKVRTVNAARTQRMEISQDRLLDNEIDTTQVLSETEDVDLARAITEFAEGQNSYQVALFSAARAIQPSLLSVLG